MHKLDATLTLALPVNAAQLAAHLQAYLSTLPTLNALRACNRFGTGSQCHINKLPVELIQSISNHCVLPVREEIAREYMSQLRCYEDTCTLRDHRSREGMLEMHGRCIDFDECECGNPYEPSDDNLSECLGNCSPLVQDWEFSIHPENRDQWRLRVGSLERNRPLFRKHFGLDLWLSTVCLGEAERSYGEAETTISCLSLPGRQERSEAWTHFECEDSGPEYGPLPCNSGCSMIVAMDAHISPEDMQRFGRTMKILELEVFIHETQQNKKPLSLASTEADSAPVVDDTEASYPRPMFLVRTQTYNCLMGGDETPTVEKVYNARLAYLISLGTAETSVVTIDLALWERELLVATVERVYNRNSFLFMTQTKVRMLYTIGLSMASIILPGFVTTLGLVFLCTTSFVPHSLPIGCLKLRSYSSPATDATAPSTDGWQTVTYNNESASDAEPETDDPILSAADQKAALYARAFAGDDVKAAFDAEKAEQAASEDEKEVSNAMPGWGSWAGAGLTKSAKKAAARQRHNPLYKTKLPGGVKQDKRQDKRLENVIVSEKSDRKGKKYLAPVLPHGFEKGEEYERSLRQPIGKEWGTKEVVQRNTRPRVVTKPGKIIEAMERPMV